MKDDRQTAAARQHSFNIMARLTTVLLVGGGLSFVFGWGASGQSFLGYFFYSERYEAMVVVVFLGVFVGALAGRAQFEWHQESRWTPAVASWAAAMVAALWLFLSSVRNYT